MLVVLLLIALVCLAGGGAALFTGFDILLGERGLPIIVGGSALLTSGIVLLGLLAMARAVRRLERSVVDRLEALGEVARLTADAASPAVIAAPRPALREPVPDVPPPDAGAAEQERAPPAGFDGMAEKPSPSSEPAPAEAVAEEANGEASIVGRYSSAGNTYVMFSDGTIEADTPTGKHRFDSIDELRAFVAAGGEDTAAG